MTAVSAFTRQCENCQKDYNITRKDQRWCSPGCRKEGTAREKAAKRAGKGKELVPAAGTGVTEVAEGVIVDEGEDTRPVGRVLSRKQWANRIRVKLRRTAQAIVSVGIDLAEAKADIPPGQSLDFLDCDLGMAERTAQRFMQVAHHEVLADPQYHDRLPASMRTLANLAAMKPQDLRKAIESGDVTPDSEQTWASRVARAYQLGEPQTLHEARLPRARPEPVPPSAQDLAQHLVALDPAAVAAGADVYVVTDIEALFQWSALVLRHLGRELPELPELPEQVKDHGHDWDAS